MFKRWWNAFLSWWDSYNEALEKRSLDPHHYERWTHD